MQKLLYNHTKINAIRKQTCSHNDNYVTITQIHINFTDTQYYILHDIILYNYSCSLMLGRNN